MTTQIALLKLKINLNRKIFIQNKEKIEQEINNLQHHLLATEDSYRLIEKTLEHELETLKNKKVTTTTSHTLPTPVSAITGQKEQNAGNKHKEETIQVIDLTNPKKERQGCKYCTQTFPDVTTCRIHIRKNHETNTKKSRSVNYSPSKRRISR